jgi:ribosomal protein S11
MEIGPGRNLRVRRPSIIFPALLLAAAVGCSRSGDGTIGVQLVYPTPAAPAAAPPRAPNYATHPSDRILVRVLGPHFAPVERWFVRSAGRGEIDGIPAGSRITVEVDEYDNTAATLGTKAPLLGRGWHNGIALAPGEVKTVPVAMYAKRTIVTICGAAPAGGSGTPGDSGDGGLGNEALLRSPPAVKAGPDDSIYISSFAATYGRVRKIDRYGYVSHFAGSGPHGTIVAGTPAASSPIDAVSDIDVDPAGNVYLFNYWNQIVRVDNGLVGKVLYDNGSYNPTARLDLAVVNFDILYFLNFIENRVYRLFGLLKNDFVSDNTPYDTTEPIGRTNYPLRAPSSITYSPIGDSLVFADTDNDRIMRVSLLDGNIYYLVANAAGTPFSEGIDPLGMAPAKPRVVDYNPVSGKIFFVEAGFNKSRVLYIDSQGKVRVFAGTGVVGFSGDGGRATAAQMNDPRAVTVDSRGNAYIADYGNHAVRMVVGGALP